MLLANHSLNAVFINVVARDNRDLREVSVQLGADFLAQVFTIDR